jgi:hypothetical protein
MSTTPSAANMRFSDNGSSRSTRETYDISKSRTLPGTYGTKTVYVQFDADGNQVADIGINDTIDYLKPVLLTEITAIANPIADSTPNYTFSSTST